MEAASAAGAAVRNGVGMRIHVAARQFALYTGEQAPVEVMWKAAAEAGIAEP